MFRLVTKPSSGLHVGIKEKILTTKIRIFLCTNRVQKQMYNNIYNLTYADFSENSRIFFCFMST
jgi:hypothetical protein